MYMQAWPALQEVLCCSSCPLLPPWRLVRLVLPPELMVKAEAANCLLSRSTWTQSAPESLILSWPGLQGVLVCGLDGAPGQKQQRSQMILSAECRTRSCAALSSVLTTCCQFQQAAHCVYLQGSTRNLPCLCTAEECLRGPMPRPSFRWCSWRHRPSSLRRRSYTMARSSNLFMSLPVLREINLHA